MSTAIDLYHQGLAPVIIASGGVEPDGQDETAVMRQMAIDAGVPSSAILLDANGVNTDATVTDTTKIMADRGLNSAMVVSHFYHLPRIKLAYQGAGVNVLTVPSRSTAIPQLPYLVAREIPAFWVYYGRAVFG
jgi:vancomycin permeability regulator SanA